MKSRAGKIAMPLLLRFKAFAFLPKSASSFSGEFLDLGFMIKLLLLKALKLLEFSGFVFATSVDGSTWL